MDASILYGIQDALGSPALDAFFPYFTMLGEAGAIWVAIAVGMLFSRKWRFWGICIIVALLLTLVVNELCLKHLVERIRPYIALGFDSIMLDNPTSYSFPSGHAGCSFAAATVIALSPAKRYWKVVVWVLALLICFSRLYLFAHYPSDVLVGAILGTIYALIAVKVGLAIRKKRKGSASGDASGGASGKHAAV
ncbi:MAG: phosphatase PAP2 family protein [Eggerthellaceae bacterium]|nr:phosphatase PAP2 family protein [Eggerthellaceae bacterium]